MQELGANPTTSGNNHTSVEPCTVVLVPSSRFVLILMATGEDVDRRCQRVAGNVRSEG